MVHSWSLAYCLLRWVITSSHLAPDIELLILQTNIEWETELSCDMENIQWLMGAKGIVRDDWSSDIYRCGTLSYK